MNDRLIRTCKIEDGRPSVEEARRRLAQEIETAKAAGYRFLKLIHGFGSSGVGGDLRIALRKSLSKRRSEGVIRGFVPGEKWSPFSEEARELVDRCPALSRDTDYARENPGITIVEL